MYSVCLLYTLFVGMSIIDCCSVVRVLSCGRYVSCSIRPRPLTYGKGGELKQFKAYIISVRLRPLTCGKGGELKQFKKSDQDLRV